MWTGITFTLEYITNIVNFLEGNSFYPVLRFSTLVLTFLEQAEAEQLGTWK